MTFHDILEVALHALWESALILPFLFVTYFLMELLEHKAEARVERAIKRAGKVGPLVGGALGLVPQCGFSALAAGFYAGRVVSVGTLLAVFLATSDEMLAVFLGARVGLGKILTVMGLKLLIAVLVGFLADLFLRRRGQDLHLEGLCEEEGCRCGESGVWRSALYHTLHVFLFVLLFELLIGFAMALAGEAMLTTVLGGVPVLALPFEGFTAIGQEVRRIISREDCLVLGCGEELLGYLPTKDDIARGAYAALESTFLYKRLPVVPGEAERLGEAMGRALDVILR